MSTWCWCVSCVFCSVNNLTSLEDFSHCPSLQELYIRKNHVEDLRDVHYLKSLERLRILWLSDNPCSQGDNYRMTVLRTLPNLHKLDNIGRFLNRFCFVSVWKRQTHYLTFTHEYTCYDVMTCANTTEKVKRVWRKPEERRKMQQFCALNFSLCGRTSLSSYSAVCFS